MAATFFGHGYKVVKGPFCPGIRIFEPGAPRIVRVKRWIIESVKVNAPGVVAVDTTSK